MPEIATPSNPVSSRETSHPCRVCKGINNVQQTQTDIFVSPISSTVAYKISTLINNLLVYFFLDTGAAVTILHRETWEK